MKALVLEEYNKLVYKDVPDPVLRDEHDILLRVRASSICGSDVHGIDGSTGRRQPPRDKERQSSRRQRVRRGSTKETDCPLHET